jgi:hypothetical protein
VRGSSGMWDLFWQAQWREGSESVKTKEEGAERKRDSHVTT